MQYMQDMCLFALSCTFRQMRAKSSKVTFGVCMNYAESFAGLIARVPSIQDRIHAFPKIVFIGDGSSAPEPIFGREPDSRYLYTTETRELRNSSGTVVPFASLREGFGPDDGVIISHIQSRAITSQLHKCGLDAVMDITHYTWRDAHMLDLDMYREHIDSIKQVFSLLDAQSAEILYSLLCFRILLDPKILRFSNYPQYFNPKLMPLMNEIIIDGGAFTGDSALMFYKNAFISAEVFAFEPDPENFHTLFMNIHARGLHNFIHPFPWGLWSERKLLSFYNAQQSSMITDSGSDHIFTVDIDSFCERHKITPSIIKLDVEGAELHTLRGAERTIRHAKPKLMISLYHVGAHIWELPLLIKEYRDDYTFHVGHHSPDLTIYETIMYAQ